MIAILSPAKSLDFESVSPYERRSDLIFAKEAEYLANKLKKFSAKKLKSMMSISDDLAQLNAERFAQWSLPFDQKNSKQAVYSFNGDVYQGLEAEKLAQQEMDFAQDHLRILSGLYGMLRPLDSIQPYRLEMGTSWAITPKKNSLYKYWKPAVTERLKEDIEAVNAEFILNLASQEYAKALDFKNIDLPVVSPDFKEERGDKFQMISFFAKKARGLMAKYAIENRIERPEELKGFDYEGYHFNESLSDLSQNKWVFTRKYESNQN
ncbi:MAG TPA: peroxide stress protein YaaA [Cryomorphaceae bacterium]|nr:peroxide stress protein YaaA [Cryomorphaceae bacterium]